MLFYTTELPAARFNTELGAFWAIELFHNNTAQQKNRVLQ
jgi:hypothetical protein